MRTFFQDDTWQSGLEEIRVRVGQPIEFCYGSDNCYLTGKEKEQMFCSEKDYRRWEKDLYHATEADLREMLNYISNYSLYAYKEEIKQGYITIEGGHRVGVAGQTVLVDGKIAGISPITFLNIRIAHEKCGCARKILPLIRQRDSIYNTLILSMPGAGKTTLLRDSIRALSNGEAYGIRLKVCVVDERSEIAASFHGVPQNDMGPRTDVMDGCGKAEGMQLLIRSMSFLCGRAGIKLWEQSAWHDPCREYERTVGKTVSETVDGAKTFSAVYISGKRSRREEKNAGL